MTRQEVEMIEHHIQKDIIERLSMAPELRFSELKPSELESNSFMYHLKQLIVSNYVAKTQTGYTLDKKGLTYVDQLSFVESRPRKQPKILGIVVLRNKKGEYVLAKRKLQPFIGTLLFPGGKQHFGESPEAHIKRELQEQFSVECAPIRRGLVDQRSYIDEVLISHVLGHVYEMVYEGPLPKESSKFVYEWAQVEDHKNLYPGTYELFKALETEKKLFFLSLDVTTD